ncbi:MAG: amidohydrolase family protein [Actinomycetota bacterium]
MGRYGHYVIDADGHGGEPTDWRRRLPDRFRPQLREYIGRMKDQYKGLPGAGMQMGSDNPRAAARPDATPANDGLDFDPPGMREGMASPAPRLADMDLEGIDVTVMFPPGSGEEWALLDRDFAVALCRTLNDARLEYASHAPDRLKLVAKLPMIDPEAAGEELDRCVTGSPDVFVGMVTAQHVRDQNLDDPSFDVVWETAQRLDVAVCTHGGGQAPDQIPFAIERFTTRLEIHAVTHPFGAMLDVTNFTVGGILHRFPDLRVGFMEAGVGWLPFWLERLDEHYELMPEQASAIDRPPSEYFRSGRCFLGCEPEERMLPYVSRTVSPDVICYASDYCHWDCAFPNSVKLLEDRDDLTDGEKAKILAGNPSLLYKIPVPA